MAEEKIQIKENDFEPVNRFIDEQSAIRRSRSFWGYAKSYALILISLGILAILLAYAYYLFKKKDYFVQVDAVKRDSFQQGQATSKNQINNLNNEISKLRSDINNYKSEGDILKSRNNTLIKNNDIIKSDLNKAQQEVLTLRDKVINNPEARLYEKALEKIRKKAEQDNTNVQTNTFIFIDKPHTLPNGKKVIVKTRWKFKDPRQDNPDIKNCYVDFQTSDIRGLELGTKNSDFNYEKYYQDKLGLKKDIFVNIKNNKCDL